MEVMMQVSEHARKAKIERAEASDMARIDLMA
jgi:hypothetical protein